VIAIIASATHTAWLEIEVIGPSIAFGGAHAKRADSFIATPFAIKLCATTHPQIALLLSLSQCFHLAFQRDTAMALFNTLGVLDSRRTFTGLQAGIWKQKTKS
jgi:hypothetical protein